MKYFWLFLLIAIQGMAATEYTIIRADYFDDAKLGSGYDYVLQAEDKASGAEACFSQGQVYYPTKQGKPTKGSALTDLKTLFQNAGVISALDTCITQNTIDKAIKDADDAAKKIPGLEGSKLP